ncbi:MAG: metalloprotease [Halobacteriales archaeon]
MALVGRFDRRERVDLAVAWAVLGVAFALFVGGPGVVVDPPRAAWLLGLCLVTAGVGFLGHELAHKLVAERLGRRAAFRADYQMLLVAVLTALVGVLVAAPGAVVHRGPPDERQVGLVAVAGPLVNLGLLGVFGVLAVTPWPVVAVVGTFGVWINALLAAFNLLPVGPLDGRSVWRYHRGVYLAVAVPAGLAAATALGWVGAIPV